MQEPLTLPLLRKTTALSAAEVLSQDAHRLSAVFSKSPIVSGAAAGSGQYFVKLRIGTPPQDLLLVADTGSDLVWVRCSACRGNCSGRALGSAFFVRRSATFSLYHCYERHCRLVPHPAGSGCNHTRLHSPCRYDYSYADGSRSVGFFAREATAVNTSSGGEVRLRGLSFGCAFHVAGPSVSGASFNGADGVMGLGQGSISFASQLGRRFHANSFSYCLKDYTISPPPTSFLTIGATAAAKMRYTPLQFNPASSTFYYVGIQSVSVDGVRLRIDPSVWTIDDAGNGGTVIDSGTTLTFLAEPAYRRVLAAMRKRVKLPRAQNRPLGFDLCVNTSGAPRLRFPRLSITLDGGAVFAPPPGNYFIDTAEGVKCLAIQPMSNSGGSGGFSVIGNLMQQGFLLEFDRDKSRLGFSRHGCARP